MMWTVKHLAVLDRLDKIVSQVVRGWEGREETQAVNADGDGRAVHPSHHLLQPLPSIPTGLLQAGESRGLADDRGPLEDAPCLWWHRYQCSTLLGINHTTSTLIQGPGDQGVSSN